jgi:hypothetical protein
VPSSLLLDPGQTQDKSLHWSGSNGSRDKCWGSKTSSIVLCFGNIWIDSVRYSLFSLVNIAIPWHWVWRRQYFDSGYSNCILLFYPHSSVWCFFSNHMESNTVFCISKLYEDQTTNSPIRNGFFGLVCSSWTLSLTLFNKLYFGLIIFNMFSSIQLYFTYSLG